MTLLDTPHQLVTDEGDARGAGRGPGRGVRRSIATAVLALVLAALLDAEALDDTARSQPFGWRRDVATAAVGPVLDVSRALHLTAPRRWLEDAFDRPHTNSDDSSPAPTTVPTPSVPTTSPSPPSTASTTPTTTPARRSPTAAAPLRLLIAGDSMTESTGPAVLDAADATGVVHATHELRYSSGLTRPDYFDWPGHLAELIATQDPEAIVVMFGANDAQGIQTPSGPAKFGSDAWTSEYRARVAAVMTMLERGSRTVYWIGLPVMRSGEFDEHTHRISEIYRLESAHHPGIRFLDTRATFADADGSYTAYLPGADGQPVLVRREDGIHLTAAGAERLAALVMTTIAEDWDLDAGAP